MSGDEWLLSIWMDTSGGNLQKSVAFSGREIQLAFARLHGGGVACGGRGGLSPVLSALSSMRQVAGPHRFWMSDEFVSLRVMMVSEDATEREQLRRGISGASIP